MAVIDLHPVTRQQVATERRAETRRQAVWALAGLAALGAVLSGTEPTTSPAADVVLNASLAVVVVYLSARARRWSWLVMAGVATLGAESTIAVAASGIGLALAFTAVAADRRNQVVGAVVAALALQGLLRLPAWDPDGLATAVTVVAILPVVASGYPNCRARVRRRLALGAAAVVVLAMASAAVATTVALSQRTTLQDGIDQARGGLRAAENGETARAGRLLARADRSFTEAAEALDAPWMRPALTVPVVGQNLEALAVAADQGAALTATANAALAGADVDALRFEDGVLDLDLVASFGPPLRESSAALDAAVDDLEAVDTPWLLPPVGDRYDDFSVELADAAEAADVAEEAITVAPALFGGEGDRRYLVLFTTPAELRGLGGFIGNYGELSAVGGDVELTRSGRIAELQPPLDGPSYAISGPADYLDRWGRYDVGRFVQDTTFSPDFPSVAQVWEEVYPQAPGGAPLDGVIVVDPYALAALMNFTGPITVPGYDIPLTAENAADILLREQYLTFQDDTGQRIDFLDDVTRLTFEALTNGDLPSPREVAEVLQPVVAQGRLMVHGVSRDEQHLFRRIDLDGALPPVGGGDFLSVTSQNSGNNKIDIFLHREIRYDVGYDPDTGRVRATVTVRLRNDAPASGLPAYVIGNRDPSRFPIGTNLQYLSVYTPWAIVDGAIDGEPIDVEAAEELGRFAYAAFVEVPPGGTRTVTFELDGATDPSADYRLTFAPQPVANPDTLSVDLTSTPGWRVCGASGLDEVGAGARFTGVPDDDLTLTTRFCGD